MDRERQIEKHLFYGFTGGQGCRGPPENFRKISVKLRIFRALKTAITLLIIGKLFTLLLKSPKIDAWIDRALPYVENCQNQGGGASLPHWPSRGG